MCLKLSMSRNASAKRAPPSVARPAAARRAPESTRRSATRSDRRNRRVSTIRFRLLALGEIDRGRHQDAPVEEVGASARPEQRARCRPAPSNNPPIRSCHRHRFRPDLPATDGVGVAGAAAPYQAVAVSLANRVLPSSDCTVKATGSWLTMAASAFSARRASASRFPLFQAIAPAAPSPVIEQPERHPVSAPKRRMVARPCDPAFHWHPYTPLNGAIRRRSGTIAAIRLSRRRPKGGSDSCFYERAKKKDLKGTHRSKRHGFRPRLSDC